jgi:branched-chain amino acid aminotransferase
VRVEAILGDVLIDGAPHPVAEAVIPVSDLALLRGYGCFEALRTYGGIPFRLGDHLDRLEMSAAALELPLPPRAELEAWVRDRAVAGGDARVRVVVTGGGGPGSAQRSRTVVFAEELPQLPAAYRVLPVVAPWHSAGARYRLTGVKSVSYAPNLSATREAQESGFDDALLVGREGEVLEGPTYSIGWVADGRAATPGPELGILASVTRRVAEQAAAAAGVPFAEAAITVGGLQAVDEVFVMSTVREIAPVVAVGDASFSAGPVTARLAAAFGEIVAAETALR